MNLATASSAAAASLGIVNPWYRLDASIAEKLAVLAALGVLTLLLLAWAFFIRKRGRRRSRRSHSRSSSGTRVAQTQVASEGRRRRRRRRQHRPRNPTLAETGGLPPLRAQEAQETPV